MEKEKAIGVLNSVIDYLGITVNQLSESIGKNRSQWAYDVLNPEKKVGISKNIAELISQKYPQISKSWLLTGEGNMLKDEQHVSEVTEVKSLSHLKSSEVKKDEQMVNLYDFEASAGLRSLLDNNHANIIDFIRIPNLPKCDGAIHIVGDSMYPLLKSGDIVLYKEMPVDMQHLFYGEMYLISYIIEGDAYVVVKYINRSSQGEPYITLVSQNPHHADRDIDFRTVNALALVKASIRINCMM